MANDASLEPPARARILIGASGSGAVALLPAYISALRASDIAETITVFMTHTAATFLPAHTVALFADKVVTGDQPASWPTANHVSMADQHDVFVVLPATAHLLSAVATGAAPNLLAATVLSAECPLAFFPVMSGEMWQKPAVTRNVKQLTNDGYQVVDPTWGPRYDVSLGRVVEGPMPPPPPLVVETVRDLFAQRRTA